MVHCWRKDQINLFNGELIGEHIIPELNQRLLAWFSEQRSQGTIFPLMHMVFLLNVALNKKKSTCTFVSSLLWCHVTSLFTRSVSTDGSILFPDSSFLQWVKPAWCGIREQMVRRSFKTSGTSNALNGTEEDAVFDENIPEEKKSEDEEMDDEFETDTEEEDKQ